MPEPLAVRRTLPSGNRFGEHADLADTGSTRLDGLVRADPCPHLVAIAAVTPTSRVCDDCVASGDIWVHLRMCLSCGYVGCCDSSVNHHASGHFAATGHPIARSVEPGERWRWCYVDRMLV
jgi:uncharacterized UBP type Zn finger protein